MVGKIKKIPLREVWKNEASHFTTWLEENIEQLGDAIGLELNVREREQQVGSFSLDLLAETSSGELVVIENQLEKSDHGHLGQIITYLTNLNAKVGVWITSSARQEHINVVNWLNEQTECHFYLVVIETIAIDDSKPAPYFNVICRPDSDLRDIGIHKKELSDTGKFNLQLWAQVIESCKGKLNNFVNRSPSHVHYLAGSSGKGGFSFVFLATRKFIGVELYIDVNDADENERLFNQLKKKKDALERSYGHSLIWDPIDDKRACRVRHIITQHDATKMNQDELIETLISHMQKFEAALRPEISRLSDHKLVS